MRTYCITAALLSSMSAAVAADEYYVARDVSTKRCTILESPPTTTDLVLIENGNVYFSRDEAERVKASGRECTSENSSGAPTRSADARSTSKQTDVAASDKPKVVRTVKKPANLPQTANERQVNPTVVAQRDPFSSFLSLFR